MSKADISGKDAAESLLLWARNNFLIHATISELFLNSEVLPVALTKALRQVKGDVSGATEASVIALLIQLLHPLSARPTGLDAWAKQLQGLLSEYKAAATDAQEPASAFARFWTSVIRKAYQLHSQKGHNSDEPRSVDQLRRELQEIDVTLTALKPASEEDLQRLFYRRDLEASRALLVVEVRVYLLLVRFLS